MGDGLFWWLVFPSLAAAALVILALLAVGIVAIRAGLRSASWRTKTLLLAAGALVIASPILYHAGMDLRAQHKADQRQARLAEMERADLAERLPGKFIAVGDFRPELIDFIRTRYQLSSFPAAENTRLEAAYRAYRSAERCHRRFPGEMMPGTKLPKCRRLPDSVQSALGLHEPILVFAEGRDTSMREDNFIAGQIYEIRLITPHEDLLVDYFEERTVTGTPSIFFPWAPGRLRDADNPAPPLRDFIEAALKGASR